MPPRSFGSLAANTRSPRGLQLPASHGAGRWGRRCGDLLRVRNDKLPVATAHDWVDIATRGVCRVCTGTRL